MSRVLLPAVGVAVTVLVIGGLLGGLDVGRTASTVVWFLIALAAVVALAVQRRRDR